MTTEVMTDTAVLMQSGNSGWPFMDVSLWLIAFFTLIIAGLTFLATARGWFKRSIPIDFGFRLNEKIEKTLELSTGDSAKPIFLRFQNKSKTTITGLIIDIRFMQPLALSGTNTALDYYPGRQVHGRTEDKKFFWIRLSELSLPGEENFDFRVEINTTNQTPGTSLVQVTTYSTLQDYKYKKLNLSIKMK